QRVKDDVDRHTVLVMGHVLDRHDDRDDTLVTVTTSHLVTRLDATLDGQVDLDDLQHPRCQVIALLQFALLVLELLVQQLATIHQVRLGALQLLVQTVITHAQLEPLAALDAVQDFSGQGGALLHTGAAFGSVADQGAGQTLECGRLDDAEFFLQILADLVQLLLLDGQGTAVTLDAVAGEYLNVNHGTLGAGGHAQGGVLHVGSLLTEDRTQQFLFRGQLGFALGRDLADQDVAGAHFSTDVDDARFVQLAQRRFTDVGNIGGDFLRPQLGVTGYAGQLLDVDGGETIFLHHTLGDEDGVLEVVTVPRHERHAHVLPEGQLTHVHGGAVGQNILDRHHVTFLHQRALVDAGVLVGAGVLDQRVDVDTGFARFDFVIVDPDNDTAGIDGVDHTATTGRDTDAGVQRNVALHAGTDQRLLGTQGRYGLTLHVGTHECTVGIVMLEERNQRGSNGHDLTGRHVHQGHFFRRLDAELVHVTNRYQLLDQLAITHFGTGLGDDVVRLFNGGEEYDFVGNHGVLYATVGAFQEAVLLGACIGRQGVDQ